MGLYYRAMHVAYIKELAALAPRIGGLDAASLAAEDWRVVKKEENIFFLKRAFEVGSKDKGFNKRALMRYCPPFFFFGIILFLLQDWKLALGYAACVAIGWFYAETALTTGPVASYDLRIFGYKLFGERL